MAKSKNTKRALLASVLSLMLCMAMLVGSTFAWFTDSVTSGKNKIVAGNLDIDLEYSLDPSAEPAEWNCVEGATELFGDIDLWEPGTTGVVYFRLSNPGTLALKYKLGMNFIDTVIGKNEDGGDIKLSEILEFGIVENQSETFRDREAAMAAVTGAKKLNKGYSDEQSMGATDVEKYFALVVYMPTTTGNEANYRGDKIPQIDLGINLVAKQDTVEEDSFNNDYDANAEYPTVEVSTKESFFRALENPANDTIILTDNIEISSQTPAVATDNVTIDLNGKTLTASGSLALKKEVNTYMTQEDYDRLVAERGQDEVELIFGKPEDCVGTYPIRTESQPVEATIKNGTYIVKGNGSGRVRFETGSSCVFENVTFKSDSTTLQKAIQVYVSNDTAGKNTYVFKNCTFENTYISFEVSSGRKGNYDVSFENCCFNIEKPGNSSAAISFARNATGKLNVSECVFNVKNNKANRNFAIYHNGGNGDNQGTLVEVALNNVSFTGEKIAKPDYYGGGYFISACVGEGNTGVLHITETGTNSYVLNCGEETVTTDCWSTDQAK